MKFYRFAIGTCSLLTVMLSPCFAQTNGQLIGTARAPLLVTNSAQRPAADQNAGASTAQPTQTQNLTLQEAEGIASQNHPQVQAATNLASAAHEQVREAKSTYYPFATGSATGSYAENNTRIGAGGLNSPRVFDRYGNGLAINQLVTDFGRTHELVKSSTERAQAQDENVARTREDVLLQVDQAYFDVLKAQGVLSVAEQTVKARQVVSDQVTEMERNRLKSGLDVDFARVELAQSQLLLIEAQNSLQASFAQLSVALGYSDQRTFQLVDEPLPGAPPADVSALIQQALRERPELISERLSVHADQSYALAERDLKFPTLTAVGVAGLIPVIAPGGLAPATLPRSSYSAAGFNLNIPIFNGHQFSALRAEADFRTRAEDQYLRDLQNRIVRDVRTAWLNASSGYQRLTVTQELLNEANDALNLAQSRYTLGLSSIVELTQAQLNQTQAQIDDVAAKYDYETAISNLNFQLGALR